MTMTINQIEAKINKAKNNPKTMIKICAGWYVAVIDGILYEFDYCNDVGLQEWRLLADREWVQTFRTLTDAKRSLQ